MELEEFLEVIADIQDAGWNVKVVRENEMISDQVLPKEFAKEYFNQINFPPRCLNVYAQDLRHVFDKVDRNKDEFVNRMVGT